MAEDATLRDVLVLVRTDEAHHRDVNHGYSCKIGGRPIDRAAALNLAHPGDMRASA